MPLSLFAHIHGLAQAETAAPQVKSITTGLQPSIFFKSCFPQLMIQKQKTNQQTNWMTVQGDGLYSENSLNSYSRKLKQVTRAPVTP